MRYKVYLIFIIVIFFVRCDDDNNQKKFSSFPVEYILKPHFVELEENYVHGGFSVYDTLYLLTNTPGNPLQIHVYNETFAFIGSSGRVGKGPGEIINPFMTRIDQQAGILWFADMGRQELLKFPIDSLVNNPQFLPHESVPIPKDLWIITRYDPLPENLFRFADYQSSDALISFFNSSGQRVDSLKITRNALLSNLENNPEQAFMPTYMYEYHPEKDLFALGYRYSDILAIIKTDGEVVTLVQGPDGVDQIPDIADENQIRCFAHIQVDENYIYMLYSGESAFDAQQNLNIPNQIFVFDWEGKPVASLKLEHPIPQFTLDPLNNRFIAMSLTTGDVVVYDIPDELIDNSD